MSRLLAQPFYTILTLHCNINKQKKNYCLYNQIQEQENCICYSPILCPSILRIRTLFFSKSCDIYPLFPTALSSLPNLQYKSSWCPTYWHFYIYLPKIPTYKNLWKSWMFLELFLKVRRYVRCKQRTVDTNLKNKYIYIYAYIRENTFDDRPFARILYNLHINIPP